MGMNLQRRWAAAAMAAGLLILSPVGIAHAQKLPAAVVAVIDYDQILRESKAGKSLLSQIEEQLKTFQAEIHPFQTKLESAERDLQQQKALLGAEAYAQRERSFQEEKARYDRTVQGMQRIIDRMRTQGTQEILVAAEGIVQAAIKDRGITVLFDLRQRGKPGTLSYEGMILFADERLNITQPVLAALDKVLQTVKLPETGGGQADTLQQPGLAPPPTPRLRLEPQQR